VTHAEGLDHENAIDRVLARIILGASLGAAVGLALAALEIARQDYLGLGYWRSIQILLRSQATLWVLFGVGASSILCAVGAALSRLGGASISSLWLRVLASPGPTLRYAVVVAAGGWGLAALSTGSRGRNRRDLRRHAVRSSSIGRPGDLGRSRHTPASATALQSHHSARGPGRHRRALPLSRRCSP
jgi:hypothetical protein